MRVGGRSCVFLDLVVYVYAGLRMPIIPVDGRVGGAVKLIRPNASVPANIWSRHSNQTAASIESGKWLTLCIGKLAISMLTEIDQKELQKMKCF